MNRKALRWFQGGILAAFLTIFGFGCGPSLLWFLNRGDEFRDPKPECKLAPKEGKKTVSVAILVTAPNSIGSDASMVGIDRDLEGKIAGKIMELSTYSKETPITVIDSGKVDRLRQENPNYWNTASLSDIAKKLGADYLLDVTVSSLTLYDQQTGREICRGKATVEVSVYDAVGKGKPLATYPLSSEAPLRDTSSQPIHVYRTKFLDGLAMEIAMKHVRYKAELERNLQK